jgi:outer membrane protein TolC
MNKKIRIMLILAVVFPICSQGQTLEELYRMSLGNSYGIKSAAHSVEVKKSEASSAYGLLLPQISFDIAYTHLNDDLVLDLNPIRGAMIDLQSSNMASMASMQDVLKGGKGYSDQQLAAVKAASKQKLEAGIPSFTEIVKEQNFPQAIVSLKQPIFTGGKIFAGIAAAKQKELIEEQNQKKTTNETALELYNAYLNFILAEENLNVRTEVRDNINKHVEKADKLMAAGLITKYDKLKANLALAEAERNLFEAERTRNLAKEALLSVVNNPNEQITAVEKLKYKKINYDENYFYELSVNNNPILQSLGHGKIALDYKKKAAFADFFPTVFGFGFYNVFDHYMAPGVEPKWGVGVGAHWEIFDGMRKTNNYKAAGEEAQANEMQLKEVDRKIKLLIKSKVLNMQLADAMYEKLASEITLADENLRLNRSRFESGLGVPLDVIDAETQLEGLELKRMKSLQEYYQSFAELCVIAGENELFVKEWSTIK